ncbi:Hypothetical predicted protein [Podarcis lilfordi]|uniref:Uncharacterized protein n=1 Tax=Podarcis lilfordi TaxID=74358 RepID=A0AA35K1H8_9SAUR|nr:Hypothetical predicted protein [Podarcis lilfordi]
MDEMLCLCSSPNLGMVLAFQDITARNADNQLIEDLGTVKREFINEEVRALSRAGFMVSCCKYNPMTLIQPSVESKD